MHPAPEDSIQLSITDSRFSDYETVISLNQLLFEEDRLINSYDHPLILTILATDGTEPVGFKLGYALNDREFYSAKGGVLPPYRRRGLARRMLHLMMETAARRGFTTFSYDTFPNLYKPMLILGLQEGFNVTNVEWNARYNDWQMRLTKEIGG
jgi:GNAT superfamily N-acetyltransferase